MLQVALWYHLSWFLIWFNIEINNFQYRSVILKFVLDYYDTIRFISH